MKKSIFTLAFLLFVAVQIFAQAPQTINFQAVARKPNGDPNANVTVQVQFIIRNNDPQNGLIIYNSGSQNLQTDACGMFTAKIGEMNQSQFSQIDWANSTKYLEVKADGLTIGNQQMVSVPYALYAEKTKLQAGNGISVNGNTISNTGDNDNNSSNEIQTLSVNGNQLSISGTGGNTVTLPAPPVYVPDIAIFEERYSTGTSAPISTNVNNFFTRQLNTTVLSSPNISLLSAGTENARLTLQAGTYVVDASAPCYACGNNKIFLREIGSNAVKLTGSNGFSNTVDLQSTSFMNGVITVPQGQVLTIKLDHKISSVPVTNFLGKDNNVSGVNEVYSQIKIQKIQ